MTEYARQFNMTGRQVRIEACHNDVSKFNDDGEFVCPMNQYRSGGDIGPNIGSIIGEAYGTIPHNDLDKPLSRPGCWAYPDMMQARLFRYPYSIRIKTACVC